MVSQPQLATETLLESTKEWAKRELNLLSLNTSHLPAAGRISAHSQNWERITTEVWVLKTVKEGYRLDLKASPSQRGRPVSLVKKDMEVLISEEVECLKQKGAVTAVSNQEEGFFSRIFLVPKRGGKNRPVVNLRPLNRFIRYQHFKMEGIPVVKDLLQQGDWLTRIDLKDAYFSLSIHPDHRRLLRFMWRKQAYEFSCLPFGLSSAPRVFTKLLRPVVRYLRERGVRCVIYLDDILIMNASKEDSQKHTALVLTLLECLGFLVNYQKSCLRPVQKLEFLGFIVDSIKRELSLPKEKVKDIRGEAARLLRQDKISARALAKLLGKMSAAVLAVFPAPLHYRSLQNLKHKALKAVGYEATIAMSQEARWDLAWWARSLEQWNGRKMRAMEPQIVIETDASCMGWGAFCQGESTGGCWSNEERQLHINVLELLAVWYGLRAFLKNPQVRAVLIHSDNTTVVAYINKMGGTRSQDLMVLARKIWAWCLDQHIEISAQHVPGKLNIKADFLSRYLRDRTDWILHPDLFARINDQWGPLKVDLFASRFSTQLPKFYSWRADPGAVATDAFRQSWKEVGLFAHPPWCLIARVLQKVRLEEATLVVVTPLWRAQPWFPVIVSMLVDLPLILPVGPGTLIPSPNCDCPVGIHNQLQLVAWRVSGKSSERETFQRRQSTSFFRHGERRQMLTITLPGGSGKNGVGRDICVPFRQI